uniref:Uncharacterized protein n=1 Tax=Manihot esculenta TaxID=3983 RepID=A0A2C9VGI4_MANES
MIIELIIFSSYSDDDNGGRGCGFSFYFSQCGIRVATKATIPYLKQSEAVIVASIEKLVIMDEKV